MDPLISQRLLSFDLAAHGVTAIMDAFDQELMLQSLLAKVVPYAGWYTQEDIVKAIACGCMYQDTRMDDGYLGECEPQAASIDCYIDGGEVKGPDSFEVYITQEKLQKEETEKAGR